MRCAIWVLDDNATYKYKICKTNTNTISVALSPDSMGELQEDKGLWRDNPRGAYGWEGRPIMEANLLSRF